MVFTMEKLVAKCLYYPSSLITDNLKADGMCTSSPVPQARLKLQALYRSHTTKKTLIEACTIWPSQTRQFWDIEK